MLSSLEKTKTTAKQSRLRAISSPSHVLSSSSGRFLIPYCRTVHSHSTNTGLALVVIVTGHALCVVVPYGLGPCCHDLAITGLAFAIVAGTGIAPVVFISYDYGPQHCCRCRCGPRPCSVNTVSAIQIRALPLVSYGPCPCCRCHSRRTNTGRDNILMARTITIRTTRTWPWPHMGMARSTAITC